MSKDTIFRQSLEVVARQTGYKGDGSNIDLLEWVSRQLLLAQAVGTMREDVDKLHKRVQRLEEVAYDDG